MPSGKPEAQKARNWLFCDRVFELRRPASAPEWCRIEDPGLASTEGLVRIVGVLRIGPDRMNVTRHRLTVHFYFDDHHEIYSKWYPEDDLTSVREDLSHLPSIITYETAEARGFQYNG
jgi:hypothetical protein